MAMTQSLAGKTAIITGAATGIGAATAELFAARGARVLATDIKCPGENLQRALADHADTLVFRRLDVTKGDDWSAAIEACAHDFEAPSILVNNAGMLGTGRPVHEETLEGMWATLEVNTLGMFLGMKAVIPAMLDAGSGSIVNVSSVWGLSGTPNNTAYQTAKGAAIMLSKNAAVTYAPHGIRVNTVLPGYVDTPMSRNVTDDEARKLIDFTPLGRRADPTEVAPMIAYLASDDASFTTAGVFTVDGGMAAL